MYENIENIRFLVMDVDGTLTDGTLYFGEQGEFIKGFNTKDGYGLGWMLPRAGIEGVILTGRQSPMILRRCEELGITRIYQGSLSKQVTLQQMLEEEAIEPSNIAYIGDDMNDYEAMKLVKEGGGVLGCPADSCQEIIDIADYVCVKDGGKGAVREFIEWLVK